MQQYTKEALSARRIILDPNRIDGYTSEPARRHRKKRIQKKWLKRYGYRPKPDKNIYFLEDGPIVMHPAVFRDFVRALGSELKAAAAISNYYSGGKKA